MFIAPNILRERLKNVFFIWGRGKTTIANELNKEYDFYVYSTDIGKDANWLLADPVHQPFMCRDFECEYNVKSFWELPPEVIAFREKHVQEEVTPMLVLDLIALAAKHPVVICEGDIDYKAIIPIASHSVYLHNCGTTFDWFNRPDHDNIVDITNRRTDLTEDEKAAIIQNAYAAVDQEKKLPDWVLENQVHAIRWDDQTSVRETAKAAADYFGFTLSC